MLSLIEQTPQWSLMVQQGVFSTSSITSGHVVSLSSEVSVEALMVPHRAELSDMHAFIVRGPNRSLLFLPDHDRWSDTLNHHDAASIRTWLKRLEVDIALVDGTFWSADELSARSQHEVLTPRIRNIGAIGPSTANDPEIVFIHLNHTNPLYRADAAELQTLHDLGWQVASKGCSSRQTGVMPLG